MDNKKGSKAIGKYIMGGEQGYDRPSSRRGEVLYLLRHFLPTVCLASVMMSVFAIPVLVFLIVMSGMCATAVNATKDNVASIILTYNFWSYLIAIPLIVLFGLGACGMNNVIKRLALEQGASFYDFYGGIKENWKQYCVTYLIFGVSLFFMVMGITIINVQSATLPSALYGLLYAICIIQFVFFTYFAFSASFLSLLYEMNFKDYFKNSLMVSFHGIFTHIPFILLSFGLWVLPIFLPGVAQVIVYVIAIILGPIISSFAVMLYGCYYTDKNINYELYPDYYHRGLYDYISHDEEDK